MIILSLIVAMLIWWLVRGYHSYKLINLLKQGKPSYMVYEKLWWLVPTYYSLTIPKLDMAASEEEQLKAVKKMLVVLFDIESEHYLDGHEVYIAFIDSGMQFKVITLEDLTSSFVEMEDILINKIKEKEYQETIRQAYKEILEDDDVQL